MKTKDNRPFHYAEFNTSERDKYTNTFRFDNLFPGEIEMLIEEFEEALIEKRKMIELAEKIKYTDPDRESTYIKAQDELRIVKKRLDNAKAALNKAKYL